MNESRIMARLDLRGCPEGIVLRGAEPDESIEQRYFAGWVNATTHPPHVGSWRQFCVVREHPSGRTVLEHSMKDNGTLLTGDAEWSDYAVEAEMRQFLNSTLPKDDDEFSLVARTGIVFRVQTIRRYYHFCMEGLERFVLYRRSDETHTVLGVWEQPVDRSRFLQLRVVVKGKRIQCFLDDELVIEIEDDAYLSGKTGWRTNTLAHLAGITVTMTDEVIQSATHARETRQRETQKRQQQYPQMRLWREWNVGQSRVLALARSGARSEPVLLLGGTSWLRAMDLTGGTTWQTETDQPVRLGCVVGDLQSNGTSELACVIGQRLVIIDVANGKQRVASDLPSVGPYMLGFKSMFRGDRCSPGRLYMAQLQPSPAPKSILLQEDSSGGGHTVWAYDHQLQPLWNRTLPQPAFGHQFSCYDVDDDGCDEIMAGYTLLDHDGHTLWRVEGCEYFDCYLGGRHPDAVHIGKLDGHELSAVIAGGPDGAIFVDARTGRIKARHRIGHAQYLVVGNFRPDRPRSEVWMFTAWGNFGIMTLFSGAGEELFQRQPFYGSVTIHAVKNWTGSGQDLLFVHTTERLLGLWDAEGHTVVPVPPPLDRDRDPRTASKEYPLVFVADVAGEGRDAVLLMDQGILRIYVAG